MDDATLQHWSLMAGDASLSGGVRSRSRQLHSIPSLVYRRSIGTTTGNGFWSKYWQGVRRKNGASFGLLTDVEVATGQHVQSAVTSLQLDRIERRFLLTGGSDAILSVYDLSKWGQSRDEVSSMGGNSRSFPSSTSAGSSHDKVVYKPVTQSVRVLGRSNPLEEHQPDEPPQGHSSSIVSAQWYPVDTGAFVSSSVDGSLLVWDTNSMQPVVQWNPFLSSQNESISCMHLSTSTGGRNDSLLALGSIHDASVKLVDIRSGAASHSLTAPSIAAATGTTCLQWSPSSDVSLATGGTDGAIRLWDIRKAGRRAWVTALDRDQTVPRHHQESSSPPNLRHRAHVMKSSDYTHLRPPKSSGSSLANKRRNRSRATDLFVSHNGPVSGLAFTPYGQELISTGRKDGLLCVWDLRGGHWLSHLTFHSKAKSPSAVERGRNVPIKLQQMGRDQTIVWVGCGSQVLGYHLEEGGTPLQRLQGHLDDVTSLEVLDEAELSLWSGGKDGMILSWGRSAYSAKSSRKRTWNDVYNSASLGLGSAYRGSMHTNTANRFG